MTDHIDYTLLASYLAGECSAEEAALARAWIGASPENAAAFREFEAVWKTAPRAAVAWDVDSAWARVHRDFRDRPRLTVTPSGRMTEPFDAVRSPRRWLPTRSRAWGAAAAAVAALVVGASAVMMSRSARPAAVPVTPLPSREVATAKGQRASVQLDDGTRVLLSVDSKLRFPATFGAATRDVYLEGEAFFDVAHNPRKPFMVHAASAVTRVLGTKFAVRAYAADSGVRVAVTEGRVRLRPAIADSSAGVVLTRDQVGRLTSDGLADVQHDADVQRYTNWTSGRIGFNNTRLRDVLGELEHWYDADLVLADPSLDSLRFTATFRQEPLDVIVRAIARTLGLHAQRTGRAIVFSRHSRVGQ